MGNQKSNLNYLSNATNELEEKIRRFEIDTLIHKEGSDKNSEKSFGTIYSQICFDNDLFQGENQDQLEKFLNQHFNEKMVKFITESKYFRIEETGYFDMRKIRVVFFLLTFNTNSAVDKTKNPDKVKNFFT